MKSKFLNFVGITLFGIAAYAGVALNASTTHSAAPATSVVAPAHMEIPARLSGVPEQILSHTGFTVSFNRTKLQANWVAWELTAAETEGATERSNKFIPDPQLSYDQQVVTKDYVKSGYDRGHMCPAADMHWSPRAMVECFYLSNICPQVPSLNRASWATLEKNCRKWAKAEGAVYIVCGPVFKAGRHATIGVLHSIPVPDGFYKVVLSLRRGHEKAIGFYYSNIAAKQSMDATATTVDAIERMTGINFFPALPDAQENKLESRSNLDAWE